MRQWLRIALYVTGAAVGGGLVTFFIVLFVQGTSWPLVLTVMAAGVYGIRLLVQRSRDAAEWPLLAVVPGTIAMLAGVSIVPAYLLIADRPGAALAWSVGLSALSFALLGVWIWLDGLMARRRERQFGRRDYGSLHGPNGWSYTQYVGRVPPSVRYLGAVVPTAALALVPGVGSVAVGSTVVVVGMFVVVGVAAYGVQALVLRWLDTQLVPYSLIEAVAADARMAANELTSEGGSRRDELLNRLHARLSGGSGRARGALYAVEIELRRIDDIARRSPEDLRWAEERLYRVFRDLLDADRGSGSSNLDLIQRLFDETSSQLRKMSEGRTRGGRDEAYFEALNRLGGWQAGGIFALLTHPFRSAEAIGTCVAAARELGVVLDAVWPRIQFMLTTAHRRVLTWGEIVVTGYRLMGASGIVTFLVLAAGAALTSTPALLWPGGAAVGIAVLAISAGHRKLAEAYQRRLAVVRIRRFDLADALRIKPLRTTTDLVRMGNVLYQSEPREGRLVRDDQPDQPVVALGDEHLEYLGRELVERLPSRITDELAAQLRQQVDRLASEAIHFNIDSVALGSLARQVVTPVSSSIQELMRQLEQNVLENVREAVKRSIVGEPLSPFSGFLVVQIEHDTAGHQKLIEGQGGRISARTGAQLSLILSVLDDPRGRTAAPEHGRADILAVQPVHIPGDTAARAVDFEVVIDSSSLAPSPHRTSMRVQPGGGDMKKVSFTLPEVPGEHEAWIQLFQSNRLVEVVAIPIDVTGPATVAG